MGCNNSSLVTGPAPTLNEREAENRQQRKRRTFLQNLAHDEFRRSIHDVYDIQKESEALGEGTFAVVHLATRKTGAREKYAVKVFKLSANLSAQRLRALMAEVDIMKSLNHPNIIRLQEVFQEQDRLYMVMDLAIGGDLQSWFAHNQVMFQDEQTAATIIKQVCSALMYCHERHICHGDIKLENLMFEGEAFNSEVKLVDFGLSNLLEGNFYIEPSGTADYMAPEQFKGQLRFASDMWSVGVITYVMMAGYFPYYAASEQGVILKIKWGSYSMPKEDFDRVSPDAKEFIKRLLVKQPDTRMTVKEALAHPWLKKSKARGPVSQQVVKSFSAFEQNTTLKKLALEIIAHSLEPRQMGELQEDFQRMDTDNTGSISEQNFVVALTKAGLETDDAVRLFQELDVDKSGSVQFNSFLAAAMGAQHITEDAIRNAFDRLDFHRTGKITVESLQMMLGSSAAPEEELAATIAEVDKDGDGAIDYEEFRAAVRGAIEVVGTAPDGQEEIKMATTDSLPPAPSSTSSRRGSKLGTFLGFTRPLSSASLKDLGTDRGREPMFVDTNEDMGDASTAKPGRTRLMSGDWAKRSRRQMERNLSKESLDSMVSLGENPEGSKHRGRGPMLEQTPVSVIPRGTPATKPASSSMKRTASTGNMSLASAQALTALYYLGQRPDGEPGQVPSPTPVLTDEHLAADLDDHPFVI